MQFFFDGKMVKQIIWYVSCDESNVLIN